MFHVGDPKTGSTSIQDALATGSIAVDGARPFYNARLAHNFLLRPLKILTGAETGGDRAAATRTVADVARGIAEAQAVHCVISGELLFQLEPEPLRKVIEDLFGDAMEDYRVIAYVRPHQGWITSTFAENLKIGAFFGTIEQFYAAKGLIDGALPYHRRFSKWRAAFGDRYVLRPFVRDALVGRSVVSDFAEAAFGRDSWTVSGSPKSNEALSLEDLVRLAMLQERLDGKRGWLFRHHVGWEFHRIVGLLESHGPGGPGQSTPVRMHRALAERIRARFASDAADMDRDFFAGTPLLQQALDAAVERSCEEVQPVDPRAHFSASEIHSIEVFREMISSILEKQDGPWVRFLERQRVKTRNARVREQSA